MCVLPNISKVWTEEKKSYKNVVASAYYYVCAAENFRKASLDDDAQKYAYYAEKIFKTR